jgi:hypothetical protein
LDDEERFMSKIIDCTGIEIGKRFLLFCVMTGAAHEESAARLYVLTRPFPR